MSRTTLRPEQQSDRDGSEPLSGSGLGYDTVAVVYASYLSEERGGAEVAVV